MCSLNINDSLKTPQNVVISVPSHTRSIFHSAKMIFFDFFPRKMTFPALSFFDIFHWILLKDSIEFVEHSFLSFSDFTHCGIGFDFLRKRVKAKQTLKNFHWRVRSGSLKHLSLRRLHQSIAEGTESPMMQLWPVRGWWVKFLPSERRVQNHWAQRMGIRCFWMRLK